MKKYIAALAAAASLIALASGCSQDSTGHNGMDMGSDQTTDTTVNASDLPDGVNSTDVVFAQGMIPHHEQAVEMAEHVIDNGEDPDVKALALRIKEAQGPEIEEMTSWLQDWGQDLPTDGMQGSMGDMSGSGMMSDDEMMTFNDNMGAQLDAMFLEMMIRHHEGAIEMAQEQIDNGENADAIALAENISASQRAEIEEMRGLLDT